MNIWRRSRELQEKNERLDQLANRLAEELVEKKMALALAEQALRTAERDLERSLAELHLVQQDFRHLVATATRLPAKTQPMDFSRDPFEEDTKLPDTWLTDDSVLPDVGALEELISGQGEAGEPRGPSSSSGAQGSA